MGSEIQAITGKGIPLVGNDVDTDRIIPARFLKSQIDILLRGMLRC